MKEFLWTVALAAIASAVVTGWLGAMAFGQFALSYKVVISFLSATIVANCVAQAILVWDTK